MRTRSMSKLAASSQKHVSTPPSPPVQKSVPSSVRPSLFAKANDGVRLFLEAVRKDPPDLGYSLVFITLIALAFYRVGIADSIVIGAIMAIAAVLTTLLVGVVLVVGSRWKLDINAYRVWLVIFVHVGAFAGCAVAITKWYLTPPEEAVTSLFLPYPVLRLAGNATSSIVVGVSYLALHQSKLFYYTALLGVVHGFSLGLGVTAGYHRHYGHRSYKASFPLRVLYIWLGAAAGQGSVLWWCRDHRMHHKFCDTKYDPYPIIHGFLWAHVGWIVCNKSEDLLRKGKQLEAEGFVDDLKGDFLIEFQHKYYFFLEFSSYIVPMVVATYWDDPIGGFFIAGFVGQCGAFQFTQCINSLAHMWGTKPFNSNISAVQNTLVALVTLGEGFHNYHHCFPRDYRNGSRFYHWDPTKWFIMTMEKIGLCSDLIQHKQRREWAKEFKKKPKDGHVH